MAIVFVLASTTGLWALDSFTTNFDTGYDSYFEIRGAGAIVQAGKLGTATKDYHVLAVTHDTDLLADDWVATVTYGTNGNRDYGYISAGLGDPTAGWSLGGPFFYVRNAKYYTNIDMGVFTNSPSNVYTTLETFTGYTAYGGTITITKAGDQITFETARNGVTYTSGPWSISTVAPWLDATNCRFFVGTSSLNAWITSVSIVPEPMSMGLLVAGAILGLLRRKK